MTCFACQNQDAAEGKLGEENITEIKRVYLNGVSQGLLLWRLVAKHKGTFAQAVSLMKKNLCKNCQENLDGFLSCHDNELRKRMS